MFRLEDLTAEIAVELERLGFGAAGLNVYRGGGMPDADETVRRRGFLLR